MSNGRQISLVMVGILAVVVLATSGCGKKGPPPAPEGAAVSGKVLLPNNSPLKGGTVILRPFSGLYGATGTIRSDGSFSLTDSSGRNSVPQGKYQVYVKLPADAGESVQKMVNPRYLDTENGDSDIVVEITGPTSDLTIKLKG